MNARLYDKTTGNHYTVTNVSDEMLRDARDEAFATEVGTDAKTQAWDLYYALLEIMEVQDKH